MKVLFFVVNFRADRHLLGFVDSLDVARSRCPAAQVSLHIHDNSEKIPSEQEQLLAGLGSARQWATVHFSARNLGYFGALASAQALADASMSCVVFCNPDLRVADDFLERLTGLADIEPGVIAPSILAVGDGFDQNPKYVERLSREKLIRLRRIYSHAISYVAYQGAARIREKLLGPRRSRPPSSDSHVYAPHGSMFVFTDVDFFRRLPPYPCFLFGEELFVAEEARRRRVPVTYRPQLRVTDERHASIRLLGAATRRRLMLESIRYILETYYREGSGHRS
jgi:GT2 family glycosyltransferase